MLRINAMSLRVLFLIGALVLTASGRLVASPTNEPLIRGAALSTVAVKVTLTYTATHEAMLIADFSTKDPERHSVSCLSAFRDLTYILRDESGKVVPGDPEAWKKHIEVAAGGGGYARGASPDSCSKIKVAINERRVLLSYLYPNLPRGTYTLQIGLAPRGSGKLAELAPITLSLGPNATRAF
jgi:hypothetical protein